MRDFLCGSQPSSNIHILTTTRGSFRFSERDSFVAYELRNLKEDEAFELVCLTGNGQYPFDMQPPSAENEEYQAAHEVIRFLDGHAWSMEIVSAFMADNYDPEGFTFAMELESLRNNRIFSSDSGATYRAGENAANAVELHVYLAFAAPVEEGHPIEKHGKDEETDEDDQNEEADCDFLHGVAVLACFFRI